MNCLDARRTLGADPLARTPELEAHLAGCHACGRFAGEMVRLDGLILRALKVPVPEARAPRPVAGRAVRPRWYALAAGLAGTAVLAGLLWSFAPREALATSLVEHMAHEPGSRALTATPAAPSAVGYVLARASVALGADAPLVSYANSCFFRGWFVPHLVVQTAAGPMTVMVLTHEHVAASTPIDEGGYRGVIVPAPRGAFAVLAPAGTDAASVAAVAARVAAAVHFIG